MIDTIVITLPCPRTGLAAAVALLHRLRRHPSVSAAQAIPVSVAMQPHGPAARRLPQPPTTTSRPGCKANDRRVMTIRLPWC
jgi:hypothetical protein